MTTNEGWTQAGADVAALEEKVGGGLPSVSVQVTDQWAASLRDTFAALNAPLDDQRAVRAAFAGAYITVSVLIDNLPLPWDRMDKIACILRYLHDLGSDEEFVALNDLPDLNA